MENNKSVTAVEWLIEQLIPKDQHEGIMDIIQEAKEMEKQQIIDAFIECWKENMPEGYECKQSAEYYYNETFKNK